MWMTPRDHAVFEAVKTAILGGVCGCEQFAQTSRLDGVVFGAATRSVAAI